ncbi:L,D-transpeptidase [Longimicrobium sp.]|uniref:L,D-transpeptidase n=1 Tax=Longimicrobium sp. TaxID=2029185 RepID=UPI002BFBFB42|nr:L,D-transpeptidase [Longimicrobium sp.]HSU15568.1 L,D-transpeptidase [Longimicrobium sp.]
MTRMMLRTGARAIAPALLALALAACAGHTPAAPAPQPAPAPVAIDPLRPPVRPDHRYVVVDVERNELRYMDGDRVLWRAPVGTGTGFRLSTPGRAWQFSTPTGTRYVQFKQLNPAWFRPDWWYHENKLPVPPAESPARKEEGGLGSAAVFLGDEIAIHGTDKPELLGRRVSHGCIRLSNTNALRLFHDVQVGTPVVIVGQAEVLGEQPDSVARYTRTNARRSRGPTVYRNPMDRLGTPALLARLDRQLGSAADDSAWTLTASALLERGLADDAPALRGLLERAGRPEPAPRRNEYANFLADAFSRGALRTVVSLNRITPEARQRAVEAIVEATMALYHGPADHPLAPWPTRRVPVSRLGPEGQAGWRALQDAEAAYRTRIGAAPRTALVEGR